MNVGEYIATTDYPGVHSIDLDTLAVIDKLELDITGEIEIDFYTLDFL